MNIVPYRCLPCRLKTVAQAAASRTPIYRRFHAQQPCANPEETSTSHEQIKQAQIRSDEPVDDSTVRQSVHRPQSSESPAYPEVLAERKRIHEARKAQVTSLARGLRPYTEREKKLLAMRYTPEQMEAIEAGEKAVDAEDMIEHGRLRGDAFRPQYVDDFATIRPLVDDPVPGQGKAKQKLPIPGGLSSQTADAEDPHLIRLCKQTGMTKDQIKKIRVKNLVSHRVSNQTRMGKIHSIYFLTIAGNGDGLVGIGEGKAVEDEDGRRQAMMNAIRNMKPIPRYEERTIYGEVEAKVGATVVQLSSRPPGFGNRCQSLIYELARAAGISDLAARTPRSRNKMNVVKAAFQALTNQRLPEDVALARGRKMVDVRGVYYGGNVY